MAENIDVELQEVYEGIRAADAAGDSEGVRRLAEYADQLETKRYQESRRADVEVIQKGQRERFRKGAQGIVSETVPRFLENFQQLWATGREIFGDEGAVARQVAEMGARRMAATGGDPDVEAGADLGEAAALMVPGGSMTRATGLVRELPAARSMTHAIGRTLKDAAIGGGLMQGASETAETAGDVGLSRGLGAGLGAVPMTAIQAVAGIRPAVANFAKKMVGNAQKNDALQAELQNMMKGSLPLPVSVQTGSKTFAAFERQVQKTKAQNYFNRVFEDFADSLEPMVHSMGRVRDTMHGAKGGGDAYSIALRASKAWNKEMAATQSAASRLYGQRLSNAISDAAADPARFPVPFDNMAQTAERWAAESGDQWWRQVAPGAARPAGALAELDRYFKAIKEQGLTPNLDVPELIKLRANLNALDKEYQQAARTGTKEVGQELANRHRALNQMIDAVDADMDAFLKTADPRRPAVAALLELRAANADYKEFKDIQRGMYESATAQLFGFHLTADKSKALLDIARMEPAEQRILATVLRNHDPAALADLRYTLLNNAFQELTSGAGRTAARGKVDPAVWERAILGHNNMPFGEEIFSKAQYARLRQSMSSVRVLTGTTEGQVDPNTAVQIESGLMAIASRASAFVARTMFRIGGTGKLEDLLLTERGLNSLKKVEDVYKGRAKWSDPEVRKAVGKLVSIAGVAPEVANEELGMEDYVISE